MGSVDPFERLVQALARLPGVGEKSATRLAFFILRQGEDYARELASAMVDATEQMGLCSRCMNLTEASECPICRDAQRDSALVCVVATVQDLRAIERCNEFAGTYHVLHGLLAPLDGVGPDDLKIRELMERLRGESAPREVILATQPTVEGEATALYLQRLITPLGVSVSRIASGLPMGGDFEYADPATISRALAGRQQM
ncbi:MAG TPA: recombination mediator RecR [Myxococcales bacterium LLY-WYZ-16_1]|jgi:recombination protein RecR|nr:recombination mediator RecR [Myxococcales bacterium LLY-WYZ-16_1]